MPDEQAPVPVEGAPAPTQQTPTPSSEPTTRPEGLGTPPPAYLTRDEASTLFREQLNQFTPELAEQIRQALSPDFASRDEIQKTVQSGTDKTFARLMKSLAPEMRGIDKAVTMGHMDAGAAQQAKAQMLTEAASKMDAEEEPPVPTTQPTQAPVPAQAQRLPDNAPQQAAEKLLRGAKLTWDDVRSEMDAFRRSQGRNMELSEFNELVAAKQTDRMVQGKEAEWMKNYEAKINKVKASDGAGATTPPPLGTQAEYKPKATLDDADDVGAALERRFNIPHAPGS